MATLTTIENAGLATLDVLSEVAQSLLAVQGISAPTLLTYLHAIVSVVETVNKGFSGEVTLDTVNAAIDALRGSIADNDKTALDSLNAKFPGSVPP